MSEHLYNARLQKALDRQGGLYTLVDILDAIAQGRMQSWVYGNSWVITQISVYPRRRVVEIVAAVGDLKDCRILHDRVLAFAAEQGVDLVSAFGRKGWAREASSHGWKIKTVNYLYHRDM